MTGFLGCYLVHGTSNPLHNTLLHRQVGADRRATVVSLNSMVSQGAGAIGTIVLTALADGASVNTALIVAGIVLALGAPLYLPAMRAERNGADGRRRDRCGLIPPLRAGSRQRRRISPAGHLLPHSAILVFTRNRASDGCW